MLTGWLDGFAVAFGVVFLAELGDKTQLMVLAFSTRYRALPVVLGVVTATALMMAASVLLGAALGAIVPGQLVLLFGGVAFLLLPSGRWSEKKTRTSTQPHPQRGRRAARLLDRRWSLALRSPLPSWATSRCWRRSRWPRRHSLWPHGPAPRWL